MLLAYILGISSGQSGSLVGLPKLQSLALPLMSRFYRLRCCGFDGCQRFPAPTDLRCDFRLQSASLRESPRMD